MTKSLVKKTTSLSPISNKEIDAEVVIEDGKVYLDKQDENGQKYHTLIEPDCDFYTSRTSNKCADQVEPNGLLMYVSGRCNLNCPLCYEYGNVADEPSLAEIENVLSKYKLKNVVLMGKEPTCRDDIFEVIKIASKQNRSSLLTNGVKLADYDYVARLKEAGLGSITLSFNGFDDKIYEEMNGKPLLDIKLKALDNIKRVGIKTILSATLNRGTNESEVKKLFDYCFENRSFIYELRMRTASPVGSHLDVDPFCMSELIDLVSRAVQVPKQNLYKEQAFWTELVKEMEYLFPQNLKALVRTRLCTFYFHIIKSQSDGYTTYCADLDIEALKRSKFKKARLFTEFLKVYGLAKTAESAASFLKLPELVKPKSQELMVNLRSWPNIFNIDVEENRKCPSEYYVNGKFAPFCYSNILRDKVAPRGK